MGIPFKKGNQFGVHSSARTSNSIKFYRNKVALKDIYPALEDQKVVPKALQVIIDRIMMDAKSVREKDAQMKCAIYVLDHFMPGVLEIALQPEIKLNYGDKVNELFKMFRQRLPNGHAEESGGNGADRVQQIDHENGPGTN